MVKTTKHESQVELSSRIQVAHQLKDSNEEANGTFRVSCMPKAHKHGYYGQQHKRKNLSIARITDKNL